MTHHKINLEDKVSMKGEISGTYRKVIDVGTEDIVIARFWVQPFRILERTTFSDEQKGKIQKVLNQLAEDMLSLRDDIMSYSKEVKRYFEGVKSGDFYERKGNIEYFKEVFHGKKLVENFYFHAELCKRDVYRLLKLIEPDCPNWPNMKKFFSKDPINYRRLEGVFITQYEDLGVIREIRGYIEHGDPDKKNKIEEDFDITDIYLEETEKGTAFHQPYFNYPNEVTITDLNGSKKNISLEKITVIDLLDKHFWAIFNVCENLSTFPLIKHLSSDWQPRCIAMSNYDPKCPVQWIVEPSQTPRRTVNHPPT
ncbi:hypothetical protein IPM65_07110 [Candidatus Roizmanbacteria bacterium]|nr:MAG: hypothetical protein IPM65_07110 [Candidatus Roizmanbacteria bacterium]